MNRLLRLVWRCDGEFFLHAWPTFWSPLTPCSMSKNCLRCNKRKTLDTHAWDEGTNETLRERRALEAKSYDVGYIEPKIRHTCSRCGDTYVRVLCDR